MFLDDRMNLPNYFLADLPPEAELTPTMIEAAGDTLKRNREKYLEPRSTDDMVRLLCEIGAEWLKPDNKFRRCALKSSPEQTGFSPMILEKGLDSFFRRFTPENFQALLAQDLGADFANQFWRGPNLLVHVAAGNLPNPSLMSLTLGLLTRSAQFMKCASGAALLPRLFAHSVYAMDPKLGSCLELAEWRGGHLELEHALFARADCVTATGSDESLAAIRTRVPQKSQFLGYGQRVSFGFITSEMLRAETMAQVVAHAADDVVAWDQNGCLSPHVFYVEEPGATAADQFAAQLAGKLANREIIEPRRKISVEESAAIASQRTIYEALAAHRGDVKIWASQNSTAWTVVFENETRFRFSPLNRFIFVKPAPTGAAMPAAIDAVLGKISTVGIAAPPEKMRSLARQFAGWGVTRICPLGQMQNPPLTWRHDGRPALGDLVVWTDFENESPMRTAR